MGDIRILMLIGPANPGSSSERDIDLPRTTERPVRKRGDECSDLPVWAAPQSHGRKSVVRGLLLRPLNLPIPHFHVFVITKMRDCKMKPGTWS